jgi:hypothetical protein
MLFIASFHNICKQLFVSRQNCIFEIIAVNTVFADELNAVVLLAVVKQQAVTVYAVTA